MVTQTIVYHSKKAGEVLLVWGINNWYLPSPSLLPEHTVIRRKLAYTTMKRGKDDFTITLTLPKKTKLDFLFCKSKDSSGKVIEEWDNNGKLNYTSLYDQERTLNINESSTHSSTSKGFSLLKNGWLFLSGAIILFILSLFSFKRRKPFLPTHRVAAFLGILLATVVLTCIIRLQMNQFLIHAPWLIFGAIFSDLLWLALLSIPFLLIIYLTRNWSKISVVLTVFYSILILGTILCLLLNIEIVNIIGSPFNYQWLYYSDVLNAVDAKKTIIDSIPAPIIQNVALILSGVAFLSVAFYYSINYLFQREWVKTLIILPVAILSIGFIEQKSTRLLPKNTKNPMMFFMQSLYKEDLTSTLFTYKVSDQTKQYFHSNHNEDKLYPSDTSIKNIILFVMESTPKHFVSIFDSTYQVTPNIKKWKTISKAYNNIYAHIPSTPNSMLSIVSGIYPLISYRSMVNDHPAITIPSLPGKLREGNWHTSIFFSSDLAYSNMEQYCHQQGFETINDDKTISCTFGKMEKTHSVLDGLNDRCLIERYFEWSSHFNEEKKFTIMWTNQTHYPYFVNGTPERYTTDEDLNNYLNALKNSDLAFGQLMEQLKEHHELESTLVIVIGDHGEAFGTHNQYVHASNIFEENVHIPCILFNPILFKGTTDDRISGLIDIAPTIAQVAGIKKPESWQGTSLLNEDKMQEGRTFFISPYSNFLLGTRYKDWKFIYDGTTNEKKLYDLKTDPEELNNIAALHPDIVKVEFEMLAGWVQYQNDKTKEWINKP